MTDNVHSASGDPELVRAAQQGDATAPERLRLLENHRQRIQTEMQELTTALELVDRLLRHVGNPLKTLESEETYLA